MKDENTPLMEDDLDCADGVWSRPPPSNQIQGAVTLKVGDDKNNNSNNKIKNNNTTDKKPIIVALLSVLISLPALIGAWCWPLLIATLLGVATSTASRSFAHAITFGITLAILSNLSQYVYHKCTKRRGTHWHRYGPFYFCLFAIPLVCADLMRHILMDNGMLPPSVQAKLAMYRADCDAEAMRCLSVAGVFFTIIMTYGGYLCLFIGNFWCIDLHLKIRDAWIQRRKLN